MEEFVLNANPNINTNTNYQFSNQFTYNSNNNNNNNNNNNDDDFNMNEQSHTEEDLDHYNINKVIIPPPPKMYRQDVVNLLQAFKDKMNIEFPWESFDRIKITTCILSPNIIDGIFFYPFIAFYMDIVQSEIKHITNKKKKIIPLDTTSGKIINVDCMRCIRGIVPDRKKSFRNCVMLDINSESKIQTIKLCPQTIHICGADKHSIGACNDLIEHIKRVNSYLQYLRANPDIARSMIEWIISNTTGPVVRTFQDSSFIPISFSELHDRNVVNEIDMIYLHKRLCYNPKFFTRFYDDCFYPIDRIFDDLVPMEYAFHLGDRNNNSDDLFNMTSSGNGNNINNSNSNGNNDDFNMNSNVPTYGSTSQADVGYKPPTNINAFYNSNQNNMNINPNMDNGPTYGGNNSTYNPNMNNSIPYNPIMNIGSTYGGNNSTYNPNMNNSIPYNPNMNIGSTYGGNNSTYNPNAIPYNPNMNFNYNPHQTANYNNRSQTRIQTRRVSETQFVVDPQSFFQSGIKYVSNKKTSQAETQFINRAHIYDEDLSHIERKECEYKEKFYDGYHIVDTEDDKLRRNISYDNMLNIVNLTLTKVENPNNKMYVIMKDGRMKIICADEDVSTIQSIDMNNILSRIPNNFDYGIMEYLLKLSIDYVDHSKYIDKLYTILDMSADIRLFEGNPKIERTNFCIVSLNYSIGAPVDKIALRDVFQSHSEFITEYDPTVDKNVKLSLKYATKDIPAHLLSEIHINKEIAFHTIIIYDTGEVTQSGPHIDLMIDVYNMFRHIVYEEGYKFFTDKKIEKKKNKNKPEETEEVKQQRAAQRKYNRYMLMETYYMSQFD